VLDQVDENTTVMHRFLQALACVLDEAAYIQSCIACDIPTISTLNNLVKWYWKVVIMTLNTLMLER